MTKLAPEWVRISDTVIRPARYHWTTAPACGSVHDNKLFYIYITQVVARPQLVAVGLFPARSLHRPLLSVLQNKIGR